eukprot:gnl/MRDRNA2_/MRDRNA2_31426_c0_seq1.p1 gnl/MRDRNA2_/MRDRNA2_31426_c0~~gnl/MRDRNA2_/MRDRNA2_31426_c0_seq1.p1  ORF type:complete len:143 (+),score=11.82 gnl/MRDRNA2_/MRDRNA2_31426_c0_seq1:87-515(+)
MALASLVMKVICLVLIGYCVLCAGMSYQVIKSSMLGGTMEKNPPFWTLAMSFGNFSLAWAWWPSPSQLTFDGLKMNFLRAFVFFVFWDCVLLPKSVTIGWFGPPYVYVFYGANGFWALVSLYFFFTTKPESLPEFQKPLLES